MTKDCYLLDKSQLNIGIHACRANVNRLNDAARVTLSGGKPAISYCLWSIAVEEFGKLACLLEAPPSHEKPDQFEVPEWLFGKGKGKECHKSKFNTGLRKLEELNCAANPCPVVFRVLTNTAKKTFTLQHGKRKVSGPAGTTGDYVDMSPEVLSPQDRFELLYVDWDANSGVWLVPEQLVTSIDGVRAQFTSDEKSLREAIEQLSNATSKLKRLVGMV